ncbi:winged helix-turn-helix domain-containing protein [Gallaecimonas xiamenensis]|uniref:Lysine decarboxylase transcriptional regulator, CadC n=1 Tax=Gallaecimonas xiamenensis 3-C-1 TaxID=745411 RepID=K2JTP3_9GAMM|nr:winged helix-turn-helix domain-containing protein [Gallaecimonas xiamenensis]EKE73744.1 lysine decarboxylase transcriptional regulator, CadC [Gallaecimonas xiamenensis 3-C-1]
MRDSFFFGDWQVDPKANSLRQGHKVKQVEPKAMDVLLHLCGLPGEVVSSEDLLKRCWPAADTGDNPLHKAITQLRAALGDKAGQPHYIETIRKRGYRALAEVRFPSGSEKQVTQADWQGGSPFPGLQAYSSDYAQVFFGRGQQIRVLLERLHQQLRFGRGFCLVLGPSGSGKSSLINAGIIPNLSTPQGYNGIGLLSHTTLDLADVGQGRLLLDLACALLDWELGDAPLFDNDSADSLAERLQQDPDAVLALLKAKLPKDGYALPRFGLFIDRLEVALSSPLFSHDERHQFIALLETLALSGAVLVLGACRNDFYPQLMAFDSLRAGKGNGAHFDLAPPSRAELLQMIRLPAQAAGLNWQTDPDSAQPLDELLCSDAASNPDALPMLQYMLEQLYLRRSPEGQLLVEVYQELGGIEGAIGKAAEEAMAQLSPAQQQALPRVLSMLVTLRENEESVTSRSARWADLSNEDEKALVQAMVDKRLFVSHLQHGEACFSVAHEALLRRWPRAVNWIGEHKDSLALKARLHYQAQRWLGEGKSPAYLLAQGKPLQEAKALAANPLFTLDDDASTYLGASKGRAKRRQSLRNGTLALLCALTLAAAGFGFKSNQAEKRATAQRLAAENLLGFMVGDFADKLRGIGRMDLLDGVSSQALAYFTSSAAMQDDSLGFDGRFQHGQTLEAMGEVAYSRGKGDEAKSALLAAQKELLPLLEQQPDNLELLKSLGANAFWLGQMRFDQADWPGAADWFGQYLNYSQAMYDLAPEDGTAQMELSYALNSLGSVQMKLQDFAGARNHFERSLKLKEQALEQDPEDIQRMADVIDTRSWLASAASAEGNTDEALRLYNKNSNEFKPESFSKNGYMLERLAAILQRHANLLFWKGSFKKANDVINQALDATNFALELDGNNKSWVSNKISIKINQFQICSYTVCERENEKPEALTKLVSDQARTLSSIRAEEIIALLDKVMAIRQEMMPSTEAPENMYAENSIDRYESLLKKEPGKLEVVQGLGVSYLIKAAKIDQIGSRSLRADYCQKAFNLLKPVAKDNNEPSLIASYARALDCKNKLFENSKLISKLKNIGIPPELYTMPRRKSK